MIILDNDKIKINKKLINKIGNKAYNLIKLHKFNYNIPKAIIITEEDLHHWDTINPIILDFFNNEKISIRSSPNKSLPGIFNTELNYVCDELLLSKIKSVLNDYNNEKTKKICKVLGIEGISGGVILQKMINCSLNENSGAGVLLTRQINGILELNGKYVIQKYGTDVVNNTEIYPNDINEIDLDIKNELNNIILKIENDFKWPQEIEFSFENNKIYLLQVRNINYEKDQTLFIILKDLYNKKLISENLIKKHIKKYLKNNNIYEITDVEKASYVFSGDVTSLGVTNSNILIKSLLKNEDEHLLHNINGLITHEGNNTAHISILCRNIGIPYIIIRDKIIFEKIKNYNGNIVIDAYKNKIYLGGVTLIKKKYNIKNNNNIYNFLEELCAV